VTPRRSTLTFTTLGLVFFIAIALLSGAVIVPNEIQQPGTQMSEVKNLETPDKCENCHGGYNRAVEPAFNWRGGMMANATRDPLFWATLAVAEQDFDGAGDLCIRCHSTSGWLAGRSTPTDGSALRSSDADGVECDTCHKMTNPDDSEHIGVMKPPFIANDRGWPTKTGYYGSGMLSLWGSSHKLGPYSDAAARHQSMPSQFHRSADFCGSCHDVSNPAVGDLAPGNGAQVPLENGTYSGTFGTLLTTKAAFNNFPYQYGVVERTFSEFKSGLLSTTRVSSYASLPADLKAGAIKAAFDSAKGDYADGTPRYFTCQTCHMRAVTGQGCNKSGAPIRTDLPLHDMTGGNYWVPDAILYQNQRGMLRLGGGLTATQIDALRAGKVRAEQQLALAASLTVSGNTLKVTNLTGHKLISGYPEGRRMWLNVKWYNANDYLLREDGAYGPVTVWLDGTPRQVNTLVDLAGARTRVYEAHYAMTQEWAAKLVQELGVRPDLPLAFDRLTGAVTVTLGGLAGRAPGSHQKTFHFVLNNKVVEDNRIPPYGMRYDDAQQRNALPVPATQYGSPGPGGTYQYWDEMSLNPPDGASYATIRLLYQTTSWEYIQFLYLANTGQNAFLGQEGAKLLETWFNTGMAEPFVMASATWGTPPAPECATPGVPSNLTAAGGRRQVTLTWSAGSPAPTGGYRIYYDQGGKLQYLAGVAATTTTYSDTRLSKGTRYCYVVRAWTDCDANGTFDAGTDTESGPSASACATAQ
jgi:hypothetical protein